MFWIVLFYIVLFGVAHSETDNVVQSAVHVTELGPLKVGAPIPSFNGPTSVGGRLSSRTVIGDGVVVVLSYAATWCQPCREGVPIIERVVHSDDAVRAVYVTLDTEVVKVRKWVSDIDVQSPVIVDKFSAIAKRHGVISDDGRQAKEIPITIVIDGQGIVSCIFTTEGADFEAKLREAVESAQRVVVPQEHDRYLNHPDRSGSQEEGKK